MQLFTGRKVVLASMHGKEAVIAPLLKKELGIQLILNEKLNTDRFGTFSGEIERTLSPMETLRQKCLEGMKLAKCELGIATEGSFGAHPFLLGLSAHEEIILLIDQKNELEFMAKCLVTETNFQGRELPDLHALMAFVDEVQFPNQGIILKDQSANFYQAYKDARTVDELRHQFETCQQTYGSVYAETDMRAMRNPTRMKVIQEVCEKLIEKMKVTCPTCQTPGFDVVEQLPGLPCSLCRMPTDSIRLERFACQKCQHSEEKPRKDHRTFEDPMFCSFCNP